MKLTLSSPLKRFLVSQGFGLNYEKYKHLGIKGHNGLDLVAAHGEPVYASHDGTAYYQMDDSSGEGFIIISNEPVEFQDGTVAHAKTIYWHLASIHDKKYHPVIPTDGAGHPVQRGQLIGYADNTGWSTGSHLHYGLKPVMPGEGVGWYNFAQNNGYAGAVDPTPYINYKKKASDYVDDFAAKKMKEGDIYGSNVMQALADLLRSFGQ